MAGLFSRLKGAFLAAGDRPFQNSASLKDEADIPWLAQTRNQNPNLDTGTGGLGQWIELKNSLIDSKAAACLDLRAQVLMTLPYQIVPRPETPPEAVDLVRRAISRLELSDVLEQMARASFFGVAPLEVTWEVSDGELLPCKVEAFDPWYLSFNAARQPLVLGKPMDPGKLIVHRHGADWRNPWGLGRGRSVPRWVRVKVAVSYATYRDYPAFAHDRIVLRYPADTQEAEQHKFIQIANQLLSSPGVVIPEGMTAERLQLDSKFETGVKLIDAANAEIATAILGNTLTSGEGRGTGIGSGAGAKAHQDTESGQKVADAIRAQSTLNRTLVPWIIALNLGPDVVPPQLVFDHEIQASLKERLEVALGFGGEGLDLSRSWVRKTFGIPEPVDADDTFDITHIQAAPDPTVKKIQLRDWNESERKKLKSGKIRGAFAGPGDSFPIAGPEDVAHAWGLAGHAEFPNVVRAAIRRIAKKYGWESGLPDTAKAVQASDLEIGLAHTTPAGDNLPPDPYEVFDSWAAGYRQRASATARLATLALKQAKNYDQALELVAATAKDFPTSAAEWLHASLRAARGLGVYLTAQQTAQLADDWADFSQSPELAAKWLSSKEATAASMVKGLSDEDLRNRAFWIAGVDQISVLQGLQQSLVDALNKGVPLAEFKKLMTGRPETAGLRPGQLETAYRTNIDGAYGAARFASLVASPAVENLVYVTAGDEKVRPEHRLLDGVTRPKDDPFWDTHTPPLGFNCRCTLRAADSGAKVTKADDPRIETPPTAGFGTGGRSFVGYLQSLANGPDAGLEPVAADAPGFAWVTPGSALEDLMASGPAPEGAAADGLVLDATGRGVAYLGDDATVAGALESPAEIWLTPTAAGDGRTGLQLTYLQPMPDGQVLVVSAQDGVVASQDGAQIVSDATAFRRGVRLK